MDTAMMMMNIFLILLSLNVKIIVSTTMTTATTTIIGKKPLNINNDTVIIKSSSTPIPYRWSLNDYPNPLIYPAICKQPRSSLLCDPDQLLEPSKRKNLTELLEFLPKNPERCLCKKCPPDYGGVKVSIALAERIDLTSSCDRLLAQYFADQLHQRWRFGLCNDTIFILFIHQWCDLTKSLVVTSTTRITKSILTDESMMQAIVKSNNYFKMLQKILEEIHRGVKDYVPDDVPDVLLSAEMSADNREKPNGNRYTAMILLSVIIGLIVFGMFFIAGYILITRERGEYETVSANTSNIAGDSVSAAAATTAIAIHDSDDEESGTGTTSRPPSINNDSDIDEECRISETEE